MTKEIASPAPKPVAWFQRRGGGYEQVHSSYKDDDDVFPLYAHPPADRIALLERLLEEALPYIKYPRDATDAFVIAHDKMIERIRAALEG